MTYTTCTACRICGNTDMIQVLDLGHQSLGSVFPKHGEKHPEHAPLVLVKCNDICNISTCGLVQLKHTVTADMLYTDNYGYRSGLNKTMTNHLHCIVADIEALVKFENNDIVLDIGCNDATLLSSYNMDLPIKKVGIDPSGPQFKEYYPDDVLLIPKFFDQSTFTSSLGESSKAKVVTSISMFYDLPDPFLFVQDIASILASDGVWIMEQSYMPTMIANNSFDTVCHEHLEYYCLKQIQWMCSKAGLKIIDVSLNDCNGGSFRVFIVHDKCDVYNIKEQSIKKLVVQESHDGWDTLQPYIDFNTRIDHQKKLLKHFLNTQLGDGKKVAIYGASTKGNTLLQYYDIDHKHIFAVAERNPRKYGCETPGTGIPIASEEVVRQSNPDYMLVLPWHFKDEFIIREENFLALGGSLVFPLPCLQIVGSEHNKKALIIGASGQIGHYLTTLLLEKDYNVFGMSRSHTNIKHKCFHNIIGDICNNLDLESILLAVQPDEVYNLAAITDSMESIRKPDDTVDINGKGVIQLCNSISKVQKVLKKTIKLCQANSVELYKGLHVDKVTEDNINFYPKTPYGIAKVLAYWAIRNAREIDGLYCSSSICSNIESKLRRSSYVTMKILNYLYTCNDQTDPLIIGDQDIQRDWLHAHDAANAMWHTLQQEEAGDFIISSGESNSIASFAKLASKLLNIDAEWVNNELISSKGVVLIKSDKTSYQRAFEINGKCNIHFDNAKLKNISWVQKFPDLESVIQEMIDGLCF